MHGNYFKFWYGKNKVFVGVMHLSKSQPLVFNSECYFAMIVTLIFLAFLLLLAVFKNLIDSSITWKCSSYKKNSSNFFFIWISLWIAIHILFILLTLKIVSYEGLLQSFCNIIVFRVLFIVYFFSLQIHLEKWMRGIL